MAEVTAPKRQKGLLISLLAIPVAAVVWALLWQAGFIASIVAFGLAFGVVWLYSFGSGSAPTRREAVSLLAIILAGIVVCFLAGMSMDAWSAYKSADIAGEGDFFSADFWNFFTTNLGSADLWNAYTTDILVSLAFAGLGSFGIIRSLFAPQQPAAKPAAPKA